MCLLLRVPNLIMLPLPPSSLFSPCFSPLPPLFLCAAEKVTSLGKDWHKLCLKCDRCNKILTTGGHAEVSPIMQQHYHHLQNWRPAFFITKRIQEEGAECTLSVEKKKYGGTVVQWGRMPCHCASDPGWIPARGPLPILPSSLSPLVSCLSQLFCLLSWGENAQKYL